MSAAASINLKVLGTGLKVTVGFRPAAIFVVNVSYRFCQVCGDGELSLEIQPAGFNQLTEVGTGNKII